MTDYVYNNKDRLLSEELSVDGTPTRTTSYDWDGPEQVGKTVTEGGVTTSQTQMEYDVAGRLSKVTITTYTSGQASSIVTQEFTYDAEGIKVTQTESVDSNADGVVDSSKSTDYLNDKQNHTGYSQVLEERADDGSQVRATTYTIGHDVIAQFSAAVGALVLLTDAHGSTRAVANAAAEVQQEYLYDAYGTLLNMQPANALTSLLYSGEQFNPVAGLQYLRARWYDPSIGRFTRMDPYSGNVQDPLGLHRYTYANGNPVMGVDPTGLEFSLAELSVTSFMRATLQDMCLGGILRARKFAREIAAGVNIGQASLDLAIGLATEFLYSAAFTGAARLIELARPLLNFRGVGASFARAAKSVWSLPVFKRGWQIHDILLSRLESQFGTALERLPSNFPVIDAMLGGEEYRSRALT